LDVGDPVSSPTLSPHQIRVGSAFGAQFVARELAHMGTVQLKNWAKALAGMSRVTTSMPKGIAVLLGGVVVVSVDCQRPG
jgi:hypothetical protein